MTAPRLRLTFKDLPPGLFVRAPKAADLMDLQPRMARDHASRQGIAIMMDRRIGGVEWAIHGKGASALPVAGKPGDPDAVRVAQRVVEVFAGMTANCMPGDTGPPCDARRAVADLLMAICDAPP
jgi:hypothetical protein